MSTLILKLVTISSNRNLSALEHLPGVVNEIVQGLSKRFGMVASILMCGPIPAKGGTIDVVRYVTPSAALYNNTD